MCELDAEQKLSQQKKKFPSGKFGKKDHVAHIKWTIGPITLQTQHYTQESQNIH